MSLAKTIEYITAELARQRAKKAGLDATVAALEESLRHLESLPPEVPPGQLSKQIGDAIAEILEEEHPLHRRVIHERLEARGIRVPGQDAVNNTGAHMSGDARFKSLGRGMWDLEEERRS